MVHHLYNYVPFKCILKVNGFFIIHQKLKTMKKVTQILGIIGAVLVTLGTLFKFFHWPLAGVLITLGATSLAVYMFMYIFVEEKAVNGGLGKLFVALTGIAGVFLTMGYEFKMQHWPAANILIWVFIGLFILLIVMSLFRALEEKNEDLRSKYTRIFIWLLGGGTIILYPTIIMLLGR
jgi:hypothetical protein